jgi:hypothetical protein
MEEIAMELLLVFVAGTLFGLFLCLFCDWRSRRRPDREKPVGTPPKVVEEGDSIQQTTADSGRPDNWKDIAADNQIEDPWRPGAGTPVDLDND